MNAQDKFYKTVVLGLLTPAEEEVAPGNPAVAPTPSARRARRHRDSFQAEKARIEGEIKRFRALDYEKPGGGGLFK